METITYTNARTHLKNVMDMVTTNHNPILITRQNGEPTVMMALSDYNSIEETLYLLRNPHNAARLRQAVTEIEGGQITTQPLLDA